MKEVINTEEFYSVLKKKLSKNDDLGMPSENKILLDVHEVLDNTDPKRIYLTSDWHFFKNHYKKEHNYVNTQKILTWCRQNIKPDDVFMYLGDISFRYANEEDQKESQRLLASIPGIKILILGNHDMMLGQEYFANCGFHYVYERLDWKNIIFTHKPINMDVMPEEYINIHGHIHNIKQYNTTDGKRNINVYPLYYNNQPTTLSYCLNHMENLIKDNNRSNWTQIGESCIIETSRTNLKDNQFGIPEDRKFPLDSEKHIMSAIKLFGHAEESKKKALAERIKTAAKKYNIKIPETTQVYKYLSESYFSEAFTNKIIIPTEVKNIVFDMGSVLVDADTLGSFKANKDIPDEYCEEIYDLITKKFFYEKENHSIPWYDLTQAKEYFISIAPEYIKPYTDAVFESYLPAMYKFSYTDDLIEAVRSKGYKVYYLSNWDKYSFDLERSFFEPIIEKFDGGLFSYECHIEKPSLSIYTLFTDKFNLNPNECLFFDDKQENIDAAKTCGWNAILFDNNITPSQIFEALSLKSFNISDADYIKSKVNEWGMAAMNPVIGITKPFILKMCNDCGGLINAKTYALSTDLISDKYLVINENANLEIVDGSSIRDMVVEEYEFVGDKRYIKKIEEAYYSNKVVDNTFFYTALTGKPMLSEDQIDFDPNFKKVDFPAIKEKILTRIATLNESFINATGKTPMRVNVFANKHTKKLLENKSYITIMKDLDGYYLFNTEKNIRSASIEEQNFITEQMLNSVL